MDTVQERQFFICLSPECEAIFCRICKRDAIKHYKGRTLLSCEVIDQTEAQNDLVHQIENEMSNAIIRKCPKCSLAFIKQDGCNKMMCRCGATQCYLCREANIDYEHFCGHDRDPGTKCWQCNKTCLLWEQSEPKDEEVLNNIRKKTTREFPDPPVLNEREAFKRYLNFFLNLERRAHT